MTKAHEEIIEFMAAGTTSEGMAAFKPSAQAKRQVAALIAKEKSTGLLPEERLDLDSAMQLEHLMRLAKARARQLLRRRE